MSDIYEEMWACDPTEIELSTNFSPNYIVYINVKINMILYIYILNNIFNFLDGMHYNISTEKYIIYF